MIVLRRENEEELILDAAPSESWRPEAIISDHPIENTSPVSDHSQRQPDRVSLQVMVSETPLGRPGPTGPTRVQGALRFLDEVCNSGELLELETRYNTSGNWVLENWPYEVNKLRGVIFTLTLKKVRIAEVRTVTLPRPEVAATAPGGVDVGEQPTEDADAASEERAVQSLAAMGFDKAASGFSNLATGLGF